MAYPKMSGLSEAPITDLTFSAPDDTPLPFLANDIELDGEVRALYKEAILKAGRRPMLPREIRETREAIGVNQRAFSVMLDVPLMTVRDWEAGRAKPERLAAVTLFLLRNIFDD